MLYQQIFGQIESWLTGAIRGAPFLSYALGYAYALIGAGIVVPLILTQIRKRAGGLPVYKDSRILGTVEAALYTTAWLIPEKAFVAFWLGLKTIKQLGISEWSHEAQLRFNTYLVGSAISLTFAITGAELVRWLQAADPIRPRLLIPVLLVLIAFALPHVPGPDRPIVPRAFSKSAASFYAAQNQNLANALRFEPFGVLVSHIDAVYHHTLRLAADNEFGRFVLMAHKAFLTAAGLIGQAQPDDAAPITRRAIEMIKVAAAVKDDPAFAEEWLAYEQREARWRARRMGEKPKALDIKIPVRHPTVAALMVSFGILSDSATHFTPEYYATLKWEKRDGGLYLNYFIGDQREIENAIMFLTATHLQILHVLDNCLDGKPARNKQWIEMMRIAYQLGKRYQQQYAAKYETAPEGSFDGDKTEDAEGVRTP